jgi:uncharacterized protein
MPKLQKRPDNWGLDNMDEVTPVVADRLKAGDIKTVAIASSSGKTALHYAPAWKDRARILCVCDPIWSFGSHELAPGMPKENRAKLEAMGVEIIDYMPWSSNQFNWLEPNPNPYGAVDLLSVTFDAFRMVGGQPLSIAMESGLMAANAGKVGLGEEIISVAGSARNGYIAIVMKAALSAQLFSQVPARRPAVKEILVMPATKRWW